jgi:Flp pilus assembly protein TadD
MLGVLTVVAFLPCLSNGFVTTWDDGPNLLDNPHLRGLGLESVSWAWRTFLLGVYQPLAWWLFIAQCALWGLEPGGYHLVSILWHAANAGAFFLVTRALLGHARPDLADRDRTFGSALAVALFAVHPLRVEVVAWASCQPYLPCAFLCLVCLLVYLRSTADSGPRRHGLLLLCWSLFLAALLCKPLAIPLPLVLLVLDVYPLRRLRAGRGPGDGPPARRIWLEKSPLLVLGVLFAVVAYRARSPHEGVGRPRDLSSRIAQMGYAIVYYPIKTVAPAGLMPFHPIPSRTNLGEPLFQACALIVLCLSITLFLLRGRWPGMLAAWVSYLLILTPNSGIIPIGSMLVADRYSYLATMAGFVLAAAGFASVRPFMTTRRRSAGVAVLGLVLPLCVLPWTWRQCRIWSSSETLWGYSAARFAAALREDPSSAEAHHNLGIALLYCRRLDEAILQFRAALALDPSLASSQASLGQALLESGRDDEAMSALSRAVQLDPKDPDIRGVLALLLIKKDRLDDAKAQYLEALRWAPDSSLSHAGLGVVLYRQGHIAAAASELSEAVRLDPDDFKVRDELRQVRRLLGRRSPRAPGT